MASETVEGLEIRVTVKGRITGSDGLKKDVNYDRSWKFTDGTAASQLGTVWEDEIRAAASASPETLDMDGLSSGWSGAGTDANNVKFVLIENLSTTAGQDLTVGGGDWVGPFADASDKAKVRASGLLLWIAPLDGAAITASTGDGFLTAASADLNFRALFGLDNT